MFPVAILAGGLATRLHPITEKIPKALALVGGEPFIFHQLRLLKNRGFTDVVICAWYLGEMIRESLGSGLAFGLNIQYSFDGDSPLGTGGAIKKALPFLSETFFVLYGDSYLPCNYSDIQEHFDRNEKPALMTVYRNQGKWGNCNVEMVDGQILGYDKQKQTPHMEYIDYGIGLFQSEVFACLHEGQPVDLVEIYQKLLADHKLHAYEVKQRFYEIGSFEGLRELDELLADDPDQFLRKEKR